MIRKIITKVFSGWQRRVIIIYPTSLVIFLALNLKPIQRLVGPKAMFSGQEIGASEYLGVPIWWWKSEVINDCLNGCVPTIDVTVDIYRLLLSFTIIIVVLRILYSIIKRIHRWRSWNPIRQDDDIVVFKGFSVETEDKENNLSLKLEVSDGKRSVTRKQNAVPISIDLCISGQKISDNFDINIVYTTLGQNGLLPLFTCTCGHFGCGGHYINIHLSDKSITLKNAYAPNDEPSDDKEYLRQEFEHTISLSVWYRLLRELLHRIEIEIIDSKINYLTVGVIGVNICDNIKTYEYNLDQVMNKSTS